MVSTRVFRVLTSLSLLTIHSIPTRPSLIVIFQVSSIRHNVPIPPLSLCYHFFFSSRRRHTRCLSDWSSDVCSSDLPALRLLQQRPERSAGEPWVFPSPIGDGHLVGLPKAWARVLRRAGIKNLRIHDIRRSVGTAMARTGASPHLIATGLGHRSIASARAYVRLAGEAARQALSDAVASLTTASPRDV